jgi:hypothetical protein
MNMGTDFSSRRSLERTSALLGTSVNPDDYLVFKIQPEPRSCCCSHCWPKTWKNINDFITPFGPVGHEGDALIDTGDGKYVLESHESGPEIVICIGVITASVVLVTSIVNLIATFIKAKAKDDHKHTSRMKLSRRMVNNDQVTDEILVEIDLPLKNDIEQLLNDKIRKQLENHAEPTGGINQSTASQPSDDSP